MPALDKPLLQPGDDDDDDHNPTIAAAGFRLVLVFGSRRSMLRESALTSADSMSC